MPFNGSGTFSRLYSWVVDAANSVNISSSRMDAELNGIAAALTDCVTRDGQSPPSADLPMGGKKLTNLGAAAAGTDALNRDTADARYLQAASPAMTGTPTAPTAALGTNTTQLATMAAIQAAIAALINAAPGALDTLKELADALGDDPNYATTITGLLAAKAPLASPALSGTPTAPTAGAGTSTTQVATTAFAQAAVQAAARPAFPGNVSASFSAADADNNTHKVASGVAQTLTLGSLTAGTAFTIRFTTAWSLAVAGGLSKNGAAPGGVTTGSIAANSLITFLHEGSGVWDASGQGLS